MDESGSKLGSGEHETLRFNLCGVEVDSQSMVKEFGFHLERLFIEELIHIVHYLLK
jgi:hypothetical protein